MEDRSDAKPQRFLLEPKEIPGEVVVKAIELAIQIAGPRSSENVTERASNIGDIANALIGRIYGRTPIVR